ncbi:MAG TPA: hypothetical protein PLY93_14115 [Turneriella sp.]|nr:hypothetical protein [Turneriella sp.]
MPVEELNTNYQDRMPSIAADGKFLFFSSDRPGGQGGDDIWVSQYDDTNKKWGAPQNLKGINTAASEITPSIHSDGITLYYSSNKKGGVGGYDIYFTQSKARLKNPDTEELFSGGWSPSLNLGKPFNSEFDDEYPTVTATGKRVYFTSNRPEGHGSFDVYWANVPDFARPLVRTRLKGSVFAGTSDRRVQAQLVLTLGERRIESTTDAEGNFDIPILNYNETQIQAAAAHFRAYSYTLNTRNLKGEKTLDHTIRLVRDIQLPAKIQVHVQFVNAKNRRISPRVKHRFLPHESVFNPDKVKKGSVVIPLLDIEKFNSEADAIRALEGTILEITAQLKGEEPLTAKIKLQDLLDTWQNTIPKTIPLTLTILDTSATLSVTQKKLKRLPKRTKKVRPQRR